MKRGWQIEANSSKNKWVRARVRMPQKRECCVLSMMVQKKPVCSKTVWLSFRTHRHWLCFFQANANILSIVNTSTANISVNWISNDLCLHTRFKWCTRTQTIKLCQLHLTSKNQLKVKCEERNRQKIYLDSEVHWRKKDGFEMKGKSVYIVVLHTVLPRSLLFLFFFSRLFCFLLLFTSHFSQNSLNW